MRRNRGVAVVGLAVLLAVLLGSAGMQLVPPAQAAVDADMPLALSAVGHNGAFFDVTVAAGSSVALEVAHNNLTDSPVAVRTFASTVYTIPNGGFGARDAGTVASGATLWVDYDDATFALAPEPATVHAFRVSVPASTAPGEYISSIVLQNDVPIAGAVEGAVTLDRVIRQVVAISIRVPGALRPSFVFGDVSHRVVGGNSAVAVAITNTGNQHVNPEGVMVIRDDRGRDVSDAVITMGALYAHTDRSRVAATFGGELDPGDYTVSMTLTDPETGVSATIDGARFTVISAAPASTSLAAQLPQIVRMPTENPLLIIGLLAAAVLGALALMLLAWRRRKRRRAAARASRPPEGPSSEPASESAPGETSRESAAAGPAAERP